MNAMKNKIKSQRGASITFALLLFLVCSVVSIVVVIAGSAAAGRMSERAETDQRYYAVTSAVELLCDDFKGKTVKVEYSKEAGTDIASLTESAFEVADINGNAGNVSVYPVVAAVSKKLAMMIAGLSPDNEDYNLEVTGATAGSALNCIITEVVKPDGRVVFQVSNTVDEKAAKKNIYTLQVVFNANISQSTSQYKLQYTDDDGNNTQKTMERFTTTLIWSVNSIEKGTMSV